MIKAIIFDLFETLLSEYVPQWKPKQYVAQSLGVDEKAYRQAFRELQSERYKGKIDGYGTALTQICRKLDLQPDSGAIARLEEERAVLKRKPFLALNPEVLALCRWLADAPIKVGVLSNAGFEDVAAWPDSELARYIDTAIFSCDVGMMKPERQIYLLTCNQMDVLPSESIFTGDGGSDELAGAAAAGLTPYWATWFLDQWPPWKGSAKMRTHSARYPRLRSPLDVMQLITTVSKEQ